MVSKKAYWYRDRWWDQSAFNLTRLRVPKRWFEFTGKIDMDWDDANLWVSGQSLARILGTYGISDNRTPPTGRYRSAPTIEFDGLIAATTGDAKKFLFWDSNYPSVRVRIELIHTVRNDGKTKRRRSRNFINISDTANAPLHLSNLNGSASFPPIVFNLHEEFPVHVHLDVRFTYYIEGDAEINMGNQQWPFRMRIPMFDIVSV